MSSVLKYFDKYEEKGNVVIFYLKDFPSSKIAGNKIVRELYIYLLKDETCQLNQIHRIDDLIYYVKTDVQDPTPSKVFSIRIKLTESLEDINNKIKKLTKRIEVYKNLQEPESWTEESQNLNYSTLFGKKDYSDIESELKDIDDEEPESWTEVEDNENKKIHLRK